MDLFERPASVIGTVLALAGIAVAVPVATLWWVAPLLVWVLLWHFALIGLTDTRWRQLAVVALTAPRFRHVYQKVTLPIFLYSWRRLCHPAGQGTSAPRVFRAALSSKLVDLSLIIASTYPILLLTLTWLVTGQGGRLGNVVLFPQVSLWDFWPERMSIVAISTLVFLGAIDSRQSGARRSSNPVKRESNLLKGASIGSLGRALIFISVYYVAIFGFAVLLSLSSSGALVFASGLFLGWIAGSRLADWSGTVSVLLLVTIPIAIGFSAHSWIVTLCFGVAGPLAMIVSIHLQRINLTTVALVFTIFFTVVIWLLAASTLQWSNSESVTRGLFLFLGVLPLLNGLFDALSYAMTLCLIRLGLRRWNPFVCGLIDLFVALFLFLGLGIYLVVVIAALNALAGTQILDLDRTLADIRENPRENLWVFVMLFSTAMPTVLHFCLALLGAQEMVSVPLRRLTLRLIQSDDTSFAPLFAALLLALVLLIPFLVVGGVLWLIAVWLTPTLLFLLAGYEDILLHIATHWVGAL